MEEIDIKDFLSYLKKYIIAAIVATILAVGATAFYDLHVKTPLYKTSATAVLTLMSNNSAQTTLNELNANSKLVDTYIVLAKSEPVLERAIESSGIEGLDVKTLAKNVTVSAVEDTNVLKITVQDANKENAQKLAECIREAFIKETTNVFGLENISAHGEPKLPETPSNDTTKRDLVIAAFVAIFGVVAVAFIIYYFDDSVKFSEELEQQIGLPVTGKVIRSDIKTKQSGTELLVDKYPKSVVSESIKSLRTNLQFASVDKGFKTLLVTSSVAGEGKSFVAANLATSFAQNGKKVLIVDCDLRKGRLHKIFGLPNVIGLSDLLVGDVSKITRFIQKTGIKNLSLIPRGAYPPNPSELLASNKNKKFIETVVAKYDLVIFDGAPCNAVSDSVIMSTLVDEVIVVVKDSDTRKAALMMTKESLQKVNAPVAGIVMNSVNRKTAQYYSYYGDKRK